MFSAYSRESIRAHINNPYAWNSRPYYRPPRKMPQGRCNLVTIAIQQRHATEAAGASPVAAGIPWPALG
jgi:hypothetical protein